MKRDELRITRDDDLVVVHNPEGGIDYEGSMDENPYREEDWRYNRSEGVYYLQTDVGTYVMEKVL